LPATQIPKLKSQMKGFTGECSGSWKIPALLHAKRFLHCNVALATG